jgi:hypothetical protein
VCQVHQGDEVLAEVLVGLGLLDARQVLRVQRIPVDGVELVKDIALL